MSSTCAAHGTGDTGSAAVDVALTCIEMPVIAVGVGRDCGIDVVKRWIGVGRQAFVLSIKAYINQVQGRCYAVMRAIFCSLTAHAIFAAVHRVTTGAHR